MFWNNVLPKSAVYSTLQSECGDNTLRIKNSTYVLNNNRVKFYKDLKSLDSLKRQLKISQNKLFVYSESRFH